MRWAIFVHDPDGDSGDGLIVGAMQSAEAADAKAGAIERSAARAGVNVECIVLPMESAAASNVVAMLRSRGGG